MIDDHRAGGEGTPDELSRLVETLSEENRSLALENRRLVLATDVSNIFLGGKPFDDLVSLLPLIKTFVRQGPSWERAALLLPYRDASYVNLSREKLSEFPVVLEIAANVGYPVSANGFHFPVTTGLSGSAYRTGEVLVENRLQEEHPLYFCLPDDRFDLQSEVALPVISPHPQAEAVSAIITLSSSSSDAFPQEDIATLMYGLETVGKWFAFLDTANRDIKTRLYVRNKFLSDYPRLWNQAVEGKYPLSMVLFDLNSLKVVNDRYGHVAGDIYLETVASTINSSLRRSDRAYRYGGDEMVLLLPHTDKEGVRDFFLRKLKMAIEEAVVRAADKYDIIFPPEAVSAGWGDLDTHLLERGTSASPQTFLASVDDWMYQHKTEFQHAHPEWVSPR